MHELGVVFKVIDNLKEVADENNISQISSVTLSLGEVSTVIPKLLTDCWQWAIEKHDFLKGCELKITTIPASTYCEDCGKTYSTVQSGKICPHCGSEHTYLVQGQEFLIKEIEVPEDEDHAAGTEMNASEMKGEYKSAFDSASPIHTEV